MNATVPLEEVLPFSALIARKVLVCDSVETDGRFLTYTFAKQALAKNCQVLWLVGTPVTDRQVATGLKKMGSDAAVAYLRDPSNCPNLNLRCLADEIGEKGLADEQEWNGEIFLKQIYLQIRAWIQNCITESIDNKCWILLDDVSTLATMLGEKLVYQFVDSVCALSTRLGNDAVGVLIRCSNELDQELLKNTDEDFEKDQSGWLGAGGLAHRIDVRENLKRLVPWERFIEAVDGIVDVLPLTSGYSREAHGRIVFSEVPDGRGWGEPNSLQTGQGSNSWNKLLFNYCIHDNGVRAIRLRA